jgi:hypothetical protein
VRLRDETRARTRRIVLDEPIIVLARNDRDDNVRFFALQICGIEMNCFPSVRIKDLARAASEDSVGWGLGAGYEWTNWHNVHAVAVNGYTDLRYAVVGRRGGAPISERGTPITAETEQATAKLRPERLCARRQLRSHDDRICVIAESSR